jgi:hypothetical protein
MRHLALTILAWSGIASAADFRVLDLGARCADIALLEASLGSTKVEWTPIEGAQVFGFRGSAFDRSLLFTYLCKHDVLMTGNYFFPIENLDTAVSSYRAVHDNLSGTYGAPRLDNSPWMQPYLEPRALQQDPRKYVTTWDNSRVAITISIMPAQPSEPEGLRVFVLYRRAHAD